MQENIFKKILIIRTDHIGDMFVTTPLIRAIHNKYPNAHIGVVASKVQSVALENNPYVDTIHVYDKKKFLNFLPFILKLRREKYMTALVVNTASSSACSIMRLCGIKNRIGIKNSIGRASSNNNVKYFTKVIIQKPDLHMIEGYLDAIESIGIASDSVKMDYILPQESLECVKKEYPTQENIFRLAIFIGNIKKPHGCWSTENFIELLKKLMINKNMEFYILGGKAEQERIPLFQTEFKEQNNLNFVMDKNFHNSALFLTTCNALLCCSSGPAHLASAIGTPVLSILYKSTYTYWRPLGAKDLEVRPKAPLNKISDNSIEDVLNMVHTFMDNENIPYIK